MLGQQLDYVNFQYTITAVAMFATLGKQKQEGIYITVNVLGQYVLSDPYEVVHLFS